MNKLTSFAFILSLTAAMSIPAMADSFCPASASIAGAGSYTTTSTVSTNATCGNVGVNMSIPSSTDYVRAEWSPTGTTLGALGGLSAGVGFTAQQAGSGPFYMLSFYDGSNSLGQGSAADQILAIEFQPSTLSGVGDDTLAMDPNSTLFNLFDNTTGNYLGGGQQSVQTLNALLSQFPSLSAESIAGFRIGIGLSGGCDDSPCAQSLTINSLQDTTNIAQTPEPASVVLLGSGLLFMGGMVFFKRSRPASLRQTA